MSGVEEPQVFPLPQCPFSPFFAMIFPQSQQFFPETEPPSSPRKAHIGKGSLPACLPALQPAFNKCLVGAHSVVYWYPKLREPLPFGVHTPGREQQCQQIHPVQSGECNCGSKARAPRDPDPCPDLRKACSQSRLLGPTPG